MPLSVSLGPEAIKYCLNDSASHLAIACESAQEQLLPRRDRLPQLRHLLGVGTALGSAVRPWLELRKHRPPTLLHTDTDCRRRRGGDGWVSPSATSGQPQAIVMTHATLLGKLEAYVCAHNFFPQHG